ncbi:hypothetical protein FB45DRAFT_1008191 [Roridomyces roridus]|uniref:Uncharacterized protein n=1 Tax=Roridomyces roridus TaxID=1738132 RepID=A0AAD7FFQ0_9AGAR|nr:hypothetical protein FB45DRAFT_1008191 [Roridomyces roridus]
MDYVGGVAPIRGSQSRRFSRDYGHDYGPWIMSFCAYLAEENPDGTTAWPPLQDLSPEGTSHWVLGFSYYYEDFVFYWDGAGEAFFRLGDSTATLAVGNSWNNATGVPANGEIILGLNVASTAAGASNRGDGPGKLVAYKIPDNLNDLD